MSLVAAYAFNEGTGTTIADAVGSNNLTLATDTIWTASGKNGAAIQGNSISGSGVSGGGALAGAYRATGPLGATAGGFTVSFWLYWAPTAYNAGERFLCLTDASGAVSLSLAQGGSDGWLRSDVFVAGANVGSGGSPTGYNTGAWHHIAFAVSATQTKTYIDATLVDTTAKSATTLDLSGAWSALGAPNNGIYAGANNADRMDDLRFYNHTQTQSEIATDMGLAVGIYALSINAGADQTIYTGQSATLTGVPNGGSGTRTYAWTKVSGPAGTFSAATSATTGFTPSAAGTYNLRCTVTDTSGSAFDDVQVTVSAPTASATVASVTTSTSWTVVPSGTATSVLADALRSTYLQSASNPTNQVLEVVLQPITAPAAGVDLVVTVAADATDAGSASLTAKLYQGGSSSGTLISTVSGLSIPSGTVGTDVAGTVIVTFPAADVAAVTSWTNGLSIKFTATAAV